MRRKWRRLAAGAFLCGLLGVAALLWWTSPSPSRLVAASLAGLLDRRVEVGEVDLDLSDTFDLTLRDLQVWNAEGTAPQLRARRARGRLRWPALLTGRLVPTSWMFDEPHLVWTERPPGERADSTAQQLPDVPAHDIEIRDGTLEWRRADGEVLRVRELQIRASRALLRNRVRGTAVGRIERQQTPVATFSAQFQGWLEALDLQTSLEGIDLAQLPLGSLPAPSGTARAGVTLRTGPDRIEGTLEIESLDFRWQLPDLRGPIAPRRLKLTADASWTGRGFRIQPRPLELDDLVVRGSVELRADAGSDAPTRLVANLDLDDFQPGRPDDRLQFFRLMGLRFKSWRDFDARTRGGWVRGARIELDVPLDELGSTLAFERKPSPAELTLSGRVTDGVYQPKPQAVPLEGITAEVRIEGNRLLLHELQMTRGAVRLPRMEIALDGMHRLVRLPVEERRVPSGPGGSIPGLGALFDALGERDPNAERFEPVLHLSDLHVGYPGFVLPLRDARATLRFPDGNLQVEDLEGVYGGVPASIQAFWDRRVDQLSVHVTYADDDAPPARPAVEPPESAWFDCRFRMPIVYFGDWRLDHVEGRFHGNGPQVEVADARALVSDGRFDARGYVELDTRGAAPFGFAIELRDANAAGIEHALGMEPGTLEGRLVGEGTLHGRLAPGRPFLADADVRLDTTLRAGSLGNTPRTLALARLASPLGWTGLFGRRLPFDEITATFEIRRGLLRTPDFSLTGPELRALAVGEIDLLDPELETDMVVALLFLQTVDTVLKRVPVVGSWVLGEDRNLIALYIQLEGPWDDPSARPVAPGAIQTATNWAGRLIGGGVERIRSLLTTGNGSRTTPGPGSNGTRDGRDPKADKGP